MAYTKTNWQNLPNTTTPVNATNLNHIETGIKDNETAISGVASDLSTLSTNVTNYTNGTTAMGSIKTTGVSINNNAINNVAYLSYTVVDTW